MKRRSGSMVQPAQESNESTQRRQRVTQRESVRSNFRISPTNPRGPHLDHMLANLHHYRLGNPSSKAG
jgi:hypothetical protein